MFIRIFGGNVEEEVASPFKCLFQYIFYTYFLPHTIADQVHSQVNHEKESPGKQKGTLKYLSLCSFNFLKIC